MSVSSRRWIVALAGIILLAALLRFAWLHTVPAGLHADEAANLFDIDSLRGGLRPIFFPRNTGREPLFIYWQAVVVHFLGANAYALRSAAALVGVVTVPAVAFAAWAMWSFEGRPTARRDALLAALALTGLYWHIHFSRMGLRTIALPLFSAITFGLFWWAARRNALVLWALSGIAGGLTLYTYTSSRALPVVAFLGGLLLLGRSRAHWRGLLVAAVLWIVVAAPLGWYTLRHPADVVGHSADLSVFSQQVNHGDLAGTLGRGIRRTAEMFLIDGSPDPFENLPHRPLLDLFSGAAFVLGLAATARRVCRPTRAFVLLWIVVGIVPATLSVNPPGFFRISAAIPAVAILAGAGAGLIWDALASRQPFLSRAAGGAAVGVLLAATIHTAWDYFGGWGPSPDAYRALRGHLAASAGLIVNWGSTERVFLAPLFAQDPTFQYLTQPAPPDTFDLGASLVVPAPSGRGVRYLFPEYDTEQLDLVRQRLPAAARLETSRDRFGQPMLVSLVLDARDLPPAPTRRIATLANIAAVVDAEIAGTPSPGAPLTVRLTWLALSKTSQDYTIFLHLRDAANQTRSQYDGRPARGTFLTGRWQPGDRVTEWYQLELPADLSPGDYRLVGGLYELKTVQRLPVILADGRESGNEALLVQFQVGAR